MKTFSVTAEPKLGADAKISRESASGADAIAVSESAKRQIGAQASDAKAKLADTILQGSNFLDGFPEVFSDGPG
jgi:hypothetical protein